MHIIFASYASIKLKKEKMLSFTWIKLLSQLRPYLARDVQWVRAGVDDQFSLLRLPIWFSPTAPSCL